MEVFGGFMKLSEEESCVDTTPEFPVPPDEEAGGDERDRDVDAHVDTRVRDEPLHDDISEEDPGDEEQDGLEHEGCLASEFHAIQIVHSRTPLLAATVLVTSCIILVKKGFTVNILAFLAYFL